MTPVQAIFFDLDNTLFDHNRAQAEALFCTLGALGEYDHTGLSDVPFDTVLAAFRRHNDEAWNRYARGEITFDECRFIRFKRTLEELGCPVDAAETMGDRFLTHYAIQTCLIDGAQEITQVLSQRYPLGIITNGYPGNSQRRKVELAGLAPYFRYIVTSEEANGAMKPDNRIFLSASQVAHVPPGEIAYIGDDYDLDILGATRVGMRTVWFHPSGQPPVGHHRSVANHHIAHLTELIEIFTDRLRTGNYSQRTVGWVIDDR
ncbi:MAG: HAD-IA family hydrolase [Candidatus Latescibacteria bacterium]|nr:HAD-IA family hydrolase [Candidatus Latescibacterota bacterium]